MNLRPYQEEAVDAVFREWEAGRRKTLLCMATGTGKTVCFAKIAERVVRSGGRVLVLAHRGELLEQARDKIGKITGLACGLEKAENTSADDYYPIVVGSVQTLMREKRLNSFHPMEFAAIIVDEAHHAVSDTYQMVLDHFEANILGVTATPDRSDKRELGKYFDSIAYTYSIADAVKNGYLCKLRALTIPLKVDLTSVRQTAGDYNAGDLGGVLEPYLHQIAEEMKSHCMGRRTVVFLPLIATSQHFRDILEGAGFRAAEVNGNSSDRAEILADFEAGKYDVICNSMLLTEGWDCPATDCIVVLRPTKSRSLYVQMVGRGTRLSEGKDDLLILDFLWMTSKHDLCRPATLITDDDDTLRAAEKILEDKAGEDMDLEDLKDEAESDVVEEREAALAAELKKQRQRKRQLVDPLQFAISIMDKDLTNYHPSFGWELEMPSKKQREELEARGIFADELRSAGEAEAILGALRERQHSGLATPKQIRCLERKGFQHVGKWLFSEASSMIGRCAAANWRIPMGIVPSTYEPESIRKPEGGGAKKPQEKPKGFNVFDELFADLD